MAQDQSGGAFCTPVAGQDCQTTDKCCGNEGAVEECSSPPGAHAPGLSNPSEQHVEAGGLAPDRAHDGAAVAGDGGLTGGGVNASALGDAPVLSPQTVWLHVYHCDPYTGFLNRVALKHADIGIYHAGVEVYGQEWCFQYFEDTWNDPTISGIIRCRPKQMIDYEYQESISLGQTQLSEGAVDQLIYSLHNEWPACSYHLTRRNCLTFAEHFVSRLRVPGTFPDWLKGILDTSNNNRQMDAVVDYSWSWIKWWMVRKHQQDDPAGAGASATDRVGEQDHSDSAWSLFCGPAASCGGALCFGDSNKAALTEDTISGRRGPSDTNSWP